MKKKISTSIKCPEKILTVRDPSHGASLQEGDLIYLDELNHLGHDYDGILSEWKEITRKVNADIVIIGDSNCLIAGCDNE